MQKSAFIWILRLITLGVIHWMSPLIGGLALATPHLTPNKSASSTTSHLGRYVSAYATKYATRYVARYADMVLIPGGSYTPFFQGGSTIRQTKVKSFYMDRHAVTNRDFLAFVKANPRWAKSKVAHLLADNTYLQQWSGDFTIGDPALLHSPVTNVSWFAAAAYAKWAGKRLPTMDEWEYVMGIPPKTSELPKGESLTTYILNWYGKPTPEILPHVMSTYKNRLGVYDMAGLIWEWVYDFNSIIKGSDSRSDSPLEKTLFCANSTQIALNKQDYGSFMRFAFRASLKANYCIRNLGFRCVRDVR